MNLKYVSDDVVKLSNDIMQKGIKKKDSLHIACAVTANCDYFITTDRKLLNKSISGIKIINPIDFIRILEV